ncbi:MAG: tyrosine-type recombinase/integrase [candidate division NC10 bacterium]|nr:tyrosine-type recombinase/integrase [candidate division NC10 bacterium]
MPTAASTVRVTGPLAPFAEGLRRFLLGEGYTPLSAANVLRLTAHLSRWLKTQRVPVALAPTRAEQFLRHRRRRGYTGFRSTRSLRPMLSYLASVGAIEWPTDADQRPACPLLQRYVAYLTTERGLTASSVRQYAATAARFLAAQADVCRLTAADVTEFILRESRRYSVGTTKLTVTALRSFLRYLRVAGEIAADRTGAVPAVAGWRLVGLPPTVTATDVAPLLAGCPRQTAVGRRDYAVILLLARLGLRAVEAATLTLDDLHWAAGEIVIRGKGSESRLPLPQDVGQALSAYVRVRGRAPTRGLFLRARAPQGGLSVAGIKAIVAQACRRARVAPIGPHRLRQAAATAMLRHGASLTQIAQVLRHRSVNTTAIYAKVDTARLRPLARPWPVGAP